MRGFVRSCFFLRLVTSSQDFLEDMAWDHYDHSPESTPRAVRKEEYEAALKAEILKYKGLAPLGEDGNPLAWWAQHRATMPLLQELAARILCVPASSASSERLFSKAGLTLTAKRTRLKPDRVAQLVTVRGAIASGVLDNYHDMPCP